MAKRYESLMKYAWLLQTDRNIEADDKLQLQSVFVLCIIKIDMQSYYIISLIGCV